jgi:hypothetical protein
MAAAAHMHALGDGRPPCLRHLHGVVVIVLLLLLSALLALLVLQGTRRRRHRWRRRQRGLGRRQIEVGAVFLRTIRGNCRGVGRAEGPREAAGGEEVELSK